MDQLFIVSYQLNLNLPVGLRDKPGISVFIPSTEPPKEAQICSWWWVIRTLQMSFYISASLAWTLSAAEMVEDHTIICQR